MNFRIRSRALLLSLAGGVMSCDLSSPMEPQNPIDLELDFCANDTPIWFAYQNEGQNSATRVFEDAEGTFRFTATNRVGIAMVFENGADYHTEFIYATNEELASMSSVGCLEEIGPKGVNGTVSGMTAGRIGVVSMGFSSAAVQPGNASYSLTGLPDRPVDLVASRQIASGSQRTADRIVIRRTQNFTNNATVPVIDFAGGEAIDAAAANATVSGVLSGEFAWLQNNVFSQLETSHSLSYVEGIGNAVFPVAAVPAASLAQGDYHDLILLSIDAAIGSVRGTETFFRAPAAQTLALGPVLSDPAIEDLSTGSNVLLRLNLPAQLSYDDAISVTYQQQLSVSSITVSQYATAGYYRGTPGVWVLPLPDLDGAPGWQDAWELRQGTAINWTVTGFSGRAELLFGAKPGDGEFVRYAVRNSDPGMVAAVRPGGTGLRNGSLRSVYTNRLRLHTP